MSRLTSLTLAAAMLFAADATSASLPAAPLARQSGAVGVVTYDPSETQTTPVPVPYA